MIPEKVQPIFRLHLFQFCSITPKFALRPRGKGTPAAQMCIRDRVWGAVRALITLASPTPFGLAIFWTEAVLNAIPGILLQLVLIPALVLSLQRARLSPVQ